MKTNRILFLAIVAGLALPAGTLLAQTNGVTAGETQPSPDSAQAVVVDPLPQPAATPPALSYGVPQIIQLAQAKVSDDTIINYIHNSGNTYGLDAAQIIYLRQQGVSDNVINAMINQPKVAGSQPAPQADVTNVYAQPTTTLVQAAPAPSSVYVIPDTQTYYYDNYYYARPRYYGYYSYPCYGPSVRLNFGFGGGWHGGDRDDFHDHDGGGYYYHNSGGGYHGGGHHHGDRH